MRPARALVLVSCLLLVYSVVAIVVAIAQDWPAEFSTTPSDDPQTVGQWIVRGSLVSAPLAPIAAQVVLTGLALLERYGWRLVAGVGFAVLGVVYTIGSLGEPLDPDRSDPPVIVYGAFRVVGLVAALTLVILGVLTTRSAIRELRRRPGRAASP